MRVFSFVAGKRRDGVPRLNHEAFIDKSPGSRFYFGHLVLIIIIQLYFFVVRVVYRTTPE